MARPTLSRHFTWLRTARILCAIIIFLGFLIVFTDFRQAIPVELGAYLAKTQFVPALQSALIGSGMLSAFILISLLLGTLIFGRVYCSFLCPLGILQDIILRIKQLYLRRNPRFFRYAPPIKGIRTTTLVIFWGAIAFGISGFTTLWLDPYSQFGRIAYLFIAPAFTWVNNLLVGHLDTFFFVKEGWAPLAWLYIPITALLTLIIFMVIKSGRLYCNTICPVGASLGLLSRFAAFRMVLDKNACIKCGKCAKSCRAQCINLRLGEVDASRCINCFDCASVCSERGFHYRWTWKKSAQILPPKNHPTTKDAQQQPRAEENKPDSLNQFVLEALPSANRRGFLAASLVGTWASLSSCEKVPVLTHRCACAEGKNCQESCGNHCGKECQKNILQAGPDRRIIPAGALNLERFLHTCTACHLCLEACPTKCLKPAYLEYGLKGILKPHLTFKETFCNFDCTACADACPTGAIMPLPLEKKQHTRIARAIFNKNHCIVTQNKDDCGACSEHCPTKALDMVPFGEVIKQPRWNNNTCSRCGDCAVACPHNAITLISDPQQPTLKIPSINHKLCIGCGKCYHACETGSLSMSPAKKWDLRIPKLNADYCIGCGACECACPVKAVVVSALSVHEDALVLVEEQVVNPNAGVDFPF